MFCCLMVCEGIEDDDICYCVIVDMVVVVDFVYYFIGGVGVVNWLLCYIQYFVIGINGYVVYGVVYFGCDVNGVEWVFVNWCVQCGGLVKLFIMLFFYCFVVVFEGGEEGMVIYFQFFCQFLW